MKKTLLICFIAACFIICMIPSVCMIFSPSNETIGNETRKPVPSVVNEEGAFNASILEDLGGYFEQNYAFRSALITADAKIQAKIFGLSNTNSITVGSDGWLYYSSTLNDFLGKNTLSERGMFNLAHNLALAQAYVSSTGAKFLFMVPPNKNTLYPEHMPYYYGKSESDIRNRDTLSEHLAMFGVKYLDLFDLLGTFEEPIYLKEDSHWNNKGAMVVYNEALKVMGKPHNDFDDVNVEKANIHSGDLSAMIYPADDYLEEDYHYEYEPAYEYVPTPLNSDPVSVEDFRIETVKTGAKDVLVMYRDSFGNTLLPLMAENFSRAYFSKGVPYTIAKDLAEYKPQYVVIELVERNIANIAKIPAIVPALRVNIPAKALTKVEAETSVEVCSADSSLAAITGTVNEEIAPDAIIYVEVPAGPATNIYEAFTVTSDDSDNGYAIYLPLGMFGNIENAQKLEINVYINAE